MSGHMRKAGFYYKSKRQKEEINAGILFTKIMQWNSKCKEMNLYERIKCKKRNTANTRHTESLLYYYFARQGLTHSHSPNKPREKEIKEKLSWRSAGVVRIPSARPLPRTCPPKQTPRDGVDVGIGPTSLSCRTRTGFSSRCYIGF